ncbi:hypothetical protein [Pseudobacteriovorax antillogorgiicola]|uniref:Uncharacterized protein n=1 Tax=Pseudobacteriovorax antillogorgiicola TaxID=1513793 RepID=A0A1Y6BPP6_9BACT|nr:hypothetical protein [Pseudobacteriovorax antillogorgiicola]TCS55483.1 hypothetical protein EDD56_105205 [Pseudobacteriovorax antillogorgiicola]SMF11889.1 hypothetical protein SAMN06296036_105119 [Pseudobacteriovorax antillogorgiicola]
MNRIASGLLFLMFSSIAFGDEFLFLCEMNWTNGTPATVRCMKEEFGAKASISEKSLRGIHQVQLQDMKSRFPEGECSTNTNRTRMSLDVRTVCKTKTRIIEFASIWPLDYRTKQYFRSSMPEIIESKILEFFRTTHFDRKLEKPIIQWGK